MAYLLEAVKKFGITRYQILHKIYLSQKSVTKKEKYHALKKKKTK